MWFKRLTVPQIVIAAIIPFAAGMELNPYFPAGWESLSSSWKVCRA
jgi:hypothetical protein